MKKTITSLALTGFLAATSQAAIAITEVMASSGLGGTTDWFELTNYDLNNSVSINGWKMDDNSFSFGNSVALSGITSIGAGESVVFLQTTDNPATQIAAFRTFWGPAASNISIGYCTGSGISFSSNGDGLVIFDASGNQMTTQISFGAATIGSSFFWGYDGSGNFVDPYGSASNGVVSTVGTITDQITYISTNELANIASPGTAISITAIPEPGGFVATSLLLGAAGLIRRRQARAA